MNSLLKYRPPRIALILLSISAGLWYFSPPMTLLYVPYWIIGGIFIAFGSTVMTWAWLQFRQAHTAVCPTAGTSTIVTNGAYKYSRNPMYFGMLAMLLGASLLMGPIHSVLAPVCFFLIIDKVFIPYEEDKLLSQFGSDYAEYMKKTGRWV